MTSRIEAYALLSDTRTAALVGRDGSVDWLCVPRFDSGSCFGALLGEPEHGRWLIAPADEIVRVARHYRPETLVLETRFETKTGSVRIVDCMSPGEERPHLVRLVEGIEGRVPMRMELIIRYDYGWVVPWVRNVDGVLHAVGGPDALSLTTPVTTRGEELTTVAEFSVTAGESIPFVLCWHPSHEPALAPSRDAADLVADAETWWRRWAASCSYRGPYREVVLSSLITLKALTYAPTGGIVAAATTSLPECIGGTRNWDYRYCWLRDATFTLYALMLSGYHDEAGAWRDWLVRAVAGTPSQIQNMYGVAGERRLQELSLPWLPGYEGSSPVRIGNAAVNQLQLDVYGEVMDALHNGRRSKLAPDPDGWRVELKLLEFLEANWSKPDRGIWEVRGPAQHFTHSKVMAWVAFDRAIQSVERFGNTGPVERWHALRTTIHDEVCRRGYDSTRNSFVQSYESKHLDAALLMIPLVGFLPHDDPRVAGTVAAIERELMYEGLVLRYRSENTVDGLPPGEGAFLACSFWLADNYAMLGRTADARRLYERLLELRNDVGLLAEEYDPRTNRMLGNFPQAFSHVGLINTAFNLSLEHPKPASERAKHSGTRHASKSSVAQSRASE